MKKFFIFSLSLSLLLASFAFIYQVWRNEYRQWQLDTFYTQQFELLFSKKLNTYLPPNELDKLEHRMFADGYNYEEVSHLRDEAHLKKCTEALLFCLEHPDKKLKSRLEPELTLVKNSLDAQLIKKFFEPTFQEKFQKAYRKKAPQSYQDIELLEKEMYLASYTPDEIQLIKQQALSAYQEELVTDYLTKVEIDP